MSDGWTLPLDLGGPAVAVLWTVVVIALALLYLARRLMHGVSDKDEGTDAMVAAAEAVRQANRALRQRLRLVVWPVGAVTAVLLVALPAPTLGVRLARSAAVLVGAGLSAVAGTGAVSVALRGNSRAASAARRSLRESFTLAVQAGGVVGLLTAGSGLLAATLIVLAFQGNAPPVLLGYAAGAAVVALALRTGGGIIAEATEAALRLLRHGRGGSPSERSGAAVTAEGGPQGPEVAGGDHHDPAVVLAMAGETLQTAAGTAAELFLVTELAFLATVILGFAAFQDGSADRASAAVVLPLAVRGLGALAAVVGIIVATPGGEEQPRTWSLVRGFLLTVILTAVVALPVAWALTRDVRPALAIEAGLGLAAAVTAFYGLGLRRGPASGEPRLTLVGHPFGASAGAGGPATSASYLLTLTGAALFSAVIGRGDLPMALYAVSLCGVGMLSVIVAATALGVFAPVAEGAGSVGSMAGGLGERAASTLTTLSEEGRATRLVVEAFVAGAAGLAVVGLMGLAVNPEIAASTTDFASRAPRLLVGLLLGAYAPLLAGLLITGTLARSTAELVFEVRRQLRDHPGIMDGRERPDLARIGAVSAGRAFLELGAPGSLAAIGPVALGFALGPDALAAAVAGALVSTPMAILVVPRDPLVPGTRCPALTPFVEVMAVASLLLAQAIHSAAGRPVLEGVLAVSAALVLALVLLWWRGRRIDAPWPWGRRE